MTYVEKILEKSQKVKENNKAGEHKSIGLCPGNSDIPETSASSPAFSEFAEGGKRVTREWGWDTTEKGLRLINAYGDFIRSLEPFSWYAHLTFTTDVHPEEANKCFHRWVRKLNEKVICRRYREKKIPGIAWVRALEYQKRDVIHFHCLLEHPEMDKVRYKRAYELWYQSGVRTGKINRIGKYNEELGACGYLSKYISKNGEIDFSQSMTWQRRRLYEQGNLLVG